MTEYFEYRDRILKEYLILSTIFLALFFALNEKSLAYGFLLGAFVSGINFYIISLNNLKIMTTASRKSGMRFFILKWLGLRYVLYFLTLVISIKYPLLGFGGVVLGLFSIPLTLLFSRLILREC